MRSGSRPAAHYVELGPGRGTLASDALRAMASVTFHPRVHFVETSPSLRERQGALIPNVEHPDSLFSLPDPGPPMVVANEFFAAPPVRPLFHIGRAWPPRFLVRPP